MMACGILATAAGVTNAQQNQTPAPPHVSVQLIAERSAISPGHSIWAGLQFQFPQGWHVYWQNPGDSGEPPKVQWNLPSGFHAGALQWPVPQRLASSASVVDYGYTDGVVLLAQLAAPANAQPGGTVSFGAGVHYLVCREICVPGKASVVLNLPVQAEQAAFDLGAHAIFEKTREQLPVAAPAAWKIHAQSRGNTFVLSIATGKSERQGVFFPLDPGEIENAAPQDAVATPDGIEFHLQKSDELLKPIARLRGVVELAGPRAYIVSAPVTQSGASR